MRTQARYIQVALLIMLSWIASNTAFGQSLLRDAPVQSDRFVDAPLVGKLPAGTPVQVLKSEAGWAQIKAGEITGWVRSSAVNGEGAKTAVTAQMQSGRLAGNNIMATSGIRGPDSVQNSGNKDEATEKAETLRKQAEDALQKK